MKDAFSQVLSHDCSNKTPLVLVVAVSWPESAARARLTMRRTRTSETMEHDPGCPLGVID